MNDQALRFRVGIFILAALILLAVLITLFGGFPTLFRGQNRYTVVFDNAPGVGPGTPVRRSGVRIGEVKNVRLDNDTGQVYVDVLVGRQYTIRNSDQAVLVQPILGGDTTIDFVAARPNGAAPDLTPAEPGATFAGVPQTSLQTLLGQGSDLLPATQETVREMNKALVTFERLLPKVDEAVREYKDLGKATRELVPELRRTNEEILVTSRNWGRLGERLDLLVQTNQDKLIKTLDNLNDTVVRVSNVFSPENQRNLNETLKNVRAGSANLDSITKNTDEFVKESRQTIRRVNDSVRQADEVLGNLQRATKPMADKSDKVMKNLDESTERLNRLVQEMREFLQAVNQGDGSLRALLTDPSLYNNLNDAACMLTRILPRVDRVLRDAELFADKIARHPESLGLGGVVHPGSGLKR